MFCCCFLCSNEDTTQPLLWRQVAEEHHSTGAVLPDLHKLAFCCSPSFGALLCSAFWALCAKRPGTTFRPESFSRWKHTESDLSVLPRESISTSLSWYLSVSHKVCVRTLQPFKWDNHNTKPTLGNECASISCRDLKKLFSKFNVTSVIVLLIEVIKTISKESIHIQKHLTYSNHYFHRSHSWQTRKSLHLDFFFECDVLELIIIMKQCCWIFFLNKTKHPPKSCKNCRQKVKCGCGGDFSCEQEEIFQPCCGNKHDPSYLIKAEIASVCLNVHFWEVRKSWRLSCPGMSFLIKERVRPKPQIPKHLKLFQNVTPNLNLTSVSVMSWTKTWPPTPMNFGKVPFPIWSCFFSL